MLGVQDDGTIVGQDVGNKTLKDIFEAINQKIFPKLLANHIKNGII